MVKISEIVYRISKNSKIFYINNKSTFSIYTILFNNDYYYDVILRPTMLCNISCKHCFLSRSNDSYTEKNLLNIIKHLGKVANKINLTFSGGEPTIHPSFKNLITSALKFDFNIITIQTNGINFHSEKLLDIIPYSDKLSFFCSFPSHIEEIYNSITMSSKYHEAMTGLINLSKKNKIVLNNVVMSQNYKYFPEMIEYIANNFERKNTNVLISNIGTPSSNSHDLFFIKYKDLIPIFKEGFKRARELSVKIDFTISGECSYPLCYYYSIDKSILENVSLFFTKPRDTFFKSEKCKLCKYDDFCQGYFKKYIEKFGDNEIEPILDSS